MRPAIIAFALTALVAGAGCAHRPHPAFPPHEPGQPEAGPGEQRNVVANSFFGRAVIHETADFCAGHIKLDSGSATVNDSCFTGDTNVVLCTDATSANPVQCAASNGKLVVAGTATDLINYARVR